MEELAQILISGAATLGIEIGIREEGCFRSFLSELLGWNRRMNLVARASPAEIIVKDFLDSLTPAHRIEQRTGSLLDIGTGAGFPGIPLKIVIPTLEVYLLEASRKKTSFLKHSIRHLALTETTVIHKRVEAIIQEESFRSRFDTVISRAAFKLPQLTRMAGYFLNAEGILLAMKGVNIDEELAAASPFAAAAGMILHGCFRLTLPVTGDVRTLIIYRKVPEQPVLTT